MNPGFGVEADEVAHQVNTGAAQLWRINGGESWLVTRIDRLAGQPPELFVMGFAGRDVAGMFPVIERAARAKGCRGFVVPVHRPGMQRIAERNGCAPRVTLMEKTFDG